MTCPFLLPRTDDSAEQKETLGKTLYLGMLFGGWYLFNIYFNMCAVQSAYSNRVCRERVNLVTL